MASRRIDDVLPALAARLGRRRWLGAALVALLVALLVAACGPSPPNRQQDLCAVFHQYPDWYDYAQDAAAEWGTPVPILMAFVHQESSYRSDARPARTYVLWFIPWGRVSSAKGYAQAQDPAWEDYTNERGSFFRSRGDMEDALDFIGWYNHGTSRELGIAKNDAYNLYLAYHEGRGGYRSGGWKSKPKLQAIAKRVAETASLYQTQLRKCEEEFECDSWYQVWPFCS